MPIYVVYYWTLDIIGTINVAKLRRISSKTPLGSTKSDMGSPVICNTNDMLGILARTSRYPT
jgi:hypothetical protein